MSASGYYVMGRVLQGTGCRVPEFSVMGRLCRVPGFSVMGREYV